MSTGNIVINGGKLCNVPDVVWNINPDIHRAGAEWYVGRPNRTLVLVNDYINPLVVVVSGNLRIDIPRNKKSGYTTSALIVNEKDLETWGINNDAELDEAVNEKKKYEYLDNPWFDVIEVQSKTKLYSCHDIFDAVQYAMQVVMG
jgi:hypothetical protein